MRFLWYSECLNVAENGEWARMTSKSSFIKWIISFIFLAVVIAFAFASATLNWQFGLTKGSNESESLLYAVLSVLSDVLKFVLPVVFFQLILVRNYAYAAITSVLFLITLSISIISSMGFTTQSTQQRMALHETLKEQYEQTLISRNDKINQLKRLGEYEPPETLEAKEQQLLGTVIRDRKRRRTTIGKATNNCADFGKVGKVTCKKVMALRVKKSRATKAESLKVEIEKLNKILPSLSKYGKTKSDPQSYVIASLTGFSENQVTKSISILIAALLETVSAFGLSLVLVFWRSFPVATKKRKKLAKPQKIEKPTTSQKSSQTLVNDNAPEPEIDISAKPRRRTKTAARKPRSKTVDTTNQATSTQKDYVVSREDCPDMTNYLEQFIGYQEGAFIKAETLHHDYCEYMNAHKKEKPSLAAFIRDLRCAFGVEIIEKDKQKGFADMILDDNVVNLNTAS